MSPQSLLSSLTVELTSINKLIKLNALSLSQVLSFCWPSRRPTRICLSLNPAKFEAILLGTHQRNNMLSNISHVNVAGSTVTLSDTVKLLGVTLDKSPNFHKHIKPASESCYERTNNLLVQKPNGHTGSIKNTDECPHKTQHSYSFTSMYTNLH